MRAPTLSTPNRSNRGTLSKVRRKTIRLRRASSSTPPRLFLPRHTFQSPPQDHQFAFGNLPRRPQTIPAAAHFPKSAARPSVCAEHLPRRPKLFLLRHTFQSPPPDHQFAFGNLPRHPKLFLPRHTFQSPPQDHQFAPSIFLDALKLFPPRHTFQSPPLGHQFAFGNLPRRPQTIPAAAHFPKSAARPSVCVRESSSTPPNYSCRGTLSKVRR